MEEQNWYVILEETGASKVKVIKCVQEATELGLKEAKELVDDAGRTTPQVIITNAKESETKSLDAALRGLGAVSSVKYERGQIST